MKQKFCILCGELLPASRHGNATTCSPEHALLLKKHREQTNYHLQRQTSLSVLETNRTLKLLAQQFGYGVPIPADEFLKSQTGRERISDEIADVAIYLIRLCQKLDLNFVEIISEKIAQNEVKYPLEKSKGSAKKYTDL